MNEALAFAGPAADFVGAFASLGVGLSEKNRVAKEKKRVDNEVRIAKENFKNQQVGQMFLKAERVRRRVKRS